MLVARSGGAILEIHAFPEHDPRGRVVQVLSRLQQLGRRLQVVVDVVGIGYNFALHIADLGFEAYQFNAGFRPIDAERFVNSKAEAYLEPARVDGTGRCLRTERSRNRGTAFGDPLPRNRIRPN